MDTEELKRISIRLGGMADLLEETAQAAARKIEESSAGLLRSVEVQVKTAMTDAAKLAVTPCAEQLKHSAESAKWAAKALGDQRLTLSRTQQSLVYLSLASLLLGSLITVGGTWVWVKNSREEVARNRIEGNFLRAVNQADITVCLDGRLCANIDTKAKREGDKHQYQIVKPR